MQRGDSKDIDGNCRGFVLIFYINEQISRLATEVCTKSVHDGKTDPVCSVVRQSRQGALTNSRLAVDIIIGDPSALVPAL